MPATSTRPTHAPLSLGFVYTALTAALSAGFGTAAALGAASAFGISGGLGWLAVLCLAVNLEVTLGQR